MTAQSIVRSRFSARISLSVSADGNPPFACRARQQLRPRAWAILPRLFELRDRFAPLALLQARVAVITGPLQNAHWAYILGFPNAIGSRLGALPGNRFHDFREELTGPVAYQQVPNWEGKIAS
jgi:hypothetical protein